MNQNQNLVLYRMMEGQSIQQYHLETLLGAGGFGGVFKAAEVVRDRVMRHLAVKLVSNTSDQQLEELNTAVSLDHPHFIRCFAAGECQVLRAEFLFLVMELAAGSLEQQLAQGAMGETAARQLVQEVATALQLLHSQKKVHRDLKPGNVLYAQNRWKLADFGLIRQLGPGSYGQTSNPIGTIGFMPPEAFDGKISTAWDLWSLGIMTAGVLTGKLPYNYRDETQLLKQVMNAAVQMPTLAEPFGSIVRGCLNPDFRKRWTADQVLAALNPPQSDPAPRIVRPPQVSPQYRREPIATSSPPQQRTHRGIPVEPFSYTSARVSPTGNVTTYQATSPIGRYVERGLSLSSGAVELAMVAIPGGTFMMGSPESEAQRRSNEGPQHQVRVPDFFIGQYEVTQAQYEAVMGNNPSTGRAWVWNPDVGEWQADTQIPAKFVGPDLPVVGVTWNEATEFCRRLSDLTGKNYRLPTEAEWEYAARAGTTTPFAYGETIVPEVVNYAGNYPYGDAPKGEYRQVTLAVDSLYPTPWGLHHIHGNVWEWTQDEYYESYSDKPDDLKRDGSRPWVKDTNVLDNDRMVMRGGSWLNNARGTRSAHRDRFRRDDRFSLNGFRVVLE